MCPLFIKWIIVPSFLVWVGRLYLQNKYIEMKIDNITADLRIHEIGKNNNIENLGQLLIYNCEYDMPIVFPKFQFPDKLIDELRINGFDVMVVETSPKYLRSFENFASIIP